MKNDMVFTRDLPDKAGFYWWTNFGEHTPTILRVTKELGKFWAQDEEFAFEIKKIDRKKIIKECKEYDLMPNEYGFYHGEELWCRIPNPVLPNGKEIDPDCF